MQNQHEIRKKENFKKQFELSKFWPPCFEKCLIKSLYLVSTADGNTLDVNNNTDSILIEELDLMQKRLKIEGLESDEYSKTIDCLRVVLDNQNWKCAQKELEKMLKELRTLDINKIRELRAEVDRAHAELKDKDVILFLGNLLMSCFLV